MGEAKRWPGETKPPFVIRVFFGGDGKEENWKVHQRKFAFSRQLWWGCEELGPLLQRVKVHQVTSDARLCRYRLRLQLQTST